MELCSCAYRSTTATSNGSTSCLTRLSSRSQSRLVANQCLSSLVKFSSRFSQAFNRLLFSFLHSYFGLLFLSISFPSPLSTPPTSPLRTFSYPLSPISLSYFTRKTYSLSLLSVIDPRYPSILYLTRKLTPKILYSLSSILFVLPLFSFLFSRRVQGFSPDRYFAMRLYLSFVFSSDEFEEIAKIANKFLTFEFRITFDLPPHCSSFIHLFKTTQQI